MKRFPSYWALIMLVLLGQPAFPQQLSETAGNLQKYVNEKNYPQAIPLLISLQNNNREIFALNNYDYLLGRLLEKTGDQSAAIAAYQGAVKRNSILSEYALWHLSSLMRAGGNLVLERLYLKQLLTSAPDSLLSEVAQLRLAESYFESKDFPAAINVLQKAKLTPAENVLPLLRSTPGADSAAGNLIGNDSRAREALLLLGRTYLSSGQTGKAREIFNRLSNELPDPASPDDLALAAVRSLDELDGGSQNAGSTIDLSEPEHLRRAGIYQFNRDFSAARVHYNALIEHFPQSPDVPRAMFQIGRGLVQESLFDEAIPWFERIQIEFPNHPICADALNQAASSYARAKKTNEAVSRYQKYIATYPDGENFDRAFLNIIDAWRDEGEVIRALEWSEKTEERFRGKVTGALAIFSRAKIYISQSDWERALRALEELREQGDLGGSRVPGGTYKEEVAFLHAYSLEQLGRINEATAEYLEIPDGRGEYYGWRATERLKAFSNDPRSAAMISGRLDQLKATANRALAQGDADGAREAAQKALRLTNDAESASGLLDIARRAYARLPAYSVTPPGKTLDFGRREIINKKARRPANENWHQAIADELLFLGLYDEGTPELETALREKDSASVFSKARGSNGSAANPLTDFPLDTSYSLARLYLRGTAPNRAAAYIEPFWKKIPDDYLIELAPRETIEMLYPAPYADSLLAESKARDLDPRFLLSIMRQESRFRPDVKSYAAARGLMQFISSTSDKIAGKLGRSDFNQDELYYPPVAVLFGAQYLKDLFDQFPGEPQAVAAAYNGGETNVARWLKRSRSNDADRYVAEMSFSQSKEYVFRVMSNYRVYRALYDQKTLSSLPADPQKP
jgi:soluble lytic murein transglycosylase